MGTPVRSPTRDRINPQGHPKAPPVDSAGNPIVNVAPDPTNVIVTTAETAVKFKDLGDNVVLVGLVGYSVAAVPKFIKIIEYTPTVLPDDEPAGVTLAHFPITANSIFSFELPLFCTGGSGRHMAVAIYNDLATLSGTADLYFTAIVHPRA